MVRLLSLLFLAICFPLIGLSQPRLQNRWVQTYPWPGDQGASNLCLTDSGDLIVAGFSSILPSETLRPFLVKLNQDGDTLWTRTYGNQETGAFAAVALVGGERLLAVGTLTDSLTGTDAYLLMTDLGGNEIWSRRFGGTGEDAARAVIASSDSTALVVGSTYSPGESGIHVFAIMLNDAGDTSWVREFRGSNGSRVEPFAVALTEDSSYLIAAQTTSILPIESDIMVIKVDRQGNLEWTHTFPRPGQQQPSALLVGADSSYVIAGTSDEPDDGFGGSVLLMKVIRDTLLTWTHAYGPWGTDDGAYALAWGPNGSYLVGGWIGLRTRMGSSGALLSVNSDGDSISTLFYGDYGAFRAHAVVPDAATGYFLAGTVTDSVGREPHMFLAAVSADQDAKELANTGIPTTNLNVFPNPFNSSATIAFDLAAPSQVSLTVHDVCGRIVAEPIDGRLEPGAHRVNVDAAALASGVYFFNLRTRGGSAVRVVAHIK